MTNWTSHMAVTPSNKPPTAESQFTEDELNELVVTLVQGINIFGDPIFSYVELPLKAFIAMTRKIRDNENFKASDYGKVLAAGTNQPSKELREEMTLTHKMFDVPQPVNAPVKLTSTVPSYTPPKFFDDQD